MFCKNCGAEIPEGSAFCGNCGMKVPAEPVQEPVNQQYQQPEEPQQPQQPEAPQDTYQSYQQPQQPETPQDTYQSYQQPQYAQQPVYNAQPVQPADIPNPTLWIVLNILMIIVGCCCSIPGILGIIGLVFAIQGNNAMKTGDMVSAVNKLKIAKILFFVGIGLFVLQTVLGLVTGLFASSIEDIQDYIYYNF